jgi:hypothetical protein
VNFHEGWQGSFDSTPPKIQFTVVVEPLQFAELLKLAETSPGATKVDIRIEGLKFDWEPDGSHLVWDTSEVGTHRPLSSFSITVERFWTTESAIREESDRRFKSELEESPDPEDRKLADKLGIVRAADPIESLLKHCRTLLALIVAVGGIIAWKLTV